MVPLEGILRLWRIEPSSSADADSSFKPLGLNDSAMGKLEFSQRPFLGSIPPIEYQKTKSPATKNR